MIYVFVTVACFCAKSVYSAKSFLFVSRSSATIGTPDCSNVSISVFIISISLSNLPRSVKPAKSEKFEFLIVDKLPNLVYNLPILADASSNEPCKKT